jgi:hypothetical protein
MQRPSHIRTTRFTPYTTRNWSQAIISLVKQAPHSPRFPGMMRSRISCAAAHTVTPAAPPCSPESQPQIDYIPASPSSVVSSPSSPSYGPTSPMASPHSGRSSPSELQLDAEPLQKAIMQDCYGKGCTNSFPIDDKDLWANPRNFCQSDPYPEIHPVCAHCWFVAKCCNAPGCCKVDAFGCLAAPGYQFVYTEDRKKAYCPMHAQLA